jgi:transposase InsO family protein
MPWKTESVMDQRLEFVIETRSKKETVSELCRRYEISRKTAYKWLKRYKTAGTIEALKDETRRPHRSPSRTSEDREQRVLAVRDEKGWGADKIEYVLAKEGIVIPAITVHRVLQRHGRVNPKDKERTATKRFARESCNELAQMDYKGEYSIRGGGKCFPLSFLDDCSRYLLGLWPQTGTDAKGAHADLEAHFREVGVPLEILLDHGSPWCSNNNLHGLTWFSLWLIKQGITLRYSGVHHPQTQGKVERMHGTFKQRTKHRGEPITWTEWVEWLRQFRYEYNFERPHESLGMKTPAEVYTADNLRPYQEHPREWEYSGGEIRRLDNKGGFKKYGQWYFVCEALVKEHVRLDEFDDKLTVTFRHMTIREINLQTRSNTAVLLKSKDKN